MNENRDNQGLQQQPNDAQRSQPDQQNQQGENRQPHQQQENPQQAQPSQQNQQADRRQGEGLEGAGQSQLNDGSVGGADKGEDLQPGRTGDGGAER